MIGNNLLMAGDEGYNLTRSLRFRSSASAYLNRTVGTPTNNKIFTVSDLVKRGSLGSRQGLIGATNAGASNYWMVQFDAADTLTVYDAYSSGVALTTTQVFRDPSAWYHIVVAQDTTQATAANRIKLYVNGVQVTSFSVATYPTQNSNTYFNASGSVASIGSWNPFATPFYYDGYQTEVNFIDGQALTPSSFGEFDPVITTWWKPKKYTGTYGTNGFYLPFTDNSALTTSSNVGLGKDFSGNGNYWTTNNISITAGVTYDSMTDVPTLTSAAVANFAVLNPLDFGATPSRLTISNGNLTATWAATSGSCASLASMAVSSGKWYWEATFVSGNFGTAGILKVGDSKANYIGSTSGGYSYETGGTKVNNGSFTAYGATYTSNDVIGIALDLDAGTLTFYKNNISQGTAFTGLSGLYQPALSDVATVALVYTLNFGQRPFTYTPPSGFVALNRFNIPEGSITTSGSFTGNVSVDGPSIYLNGVPTAMTINGNAVTFGTHADKTAYGFKVRSSSTSYNSTGTNTYSITTTGAKFKYANAQGNP